MSRLRSLDVLWIPDDTIRPPGPKMVVCIVPENGWFYRINSRDGWKPNVKLLRVPHHLFLKWDSFLECGDPLELDDYVIDEAMGRSGVIGTVSITLCDAIAATVESARNLRDGDKLVIRTVLAECR